MTPEFRVLRTEEQPACVQLWTQIFLASTDYFVRYFEEPDWKPEYTRVCVVGEQLVSSVQIVRRWVRLNGQTVPMAGIANVCTLPEYRGRGFSTRLLREAHGVIDSEDFLFGLLFTGIHDFYARLGWERLPASSWVAVPEPLSTGHWQFRSAQPEDLASVQAWYAQTYSDHPLTVIRDEPYWRIWIRWDDPNWRRNFYIAEDREGVRGYLALNTHYQTLPDGTHRVSAISVNEMGSELGDTEAMHKMVGFVASMAMDVGAEQIRFSLPQADVERWVRPVLRNLMPLPMDSAMVRVGHRERLLAMFERFGRRARQLAESLPDAIALAWLFGLSVPNLPDDYYEVLPPRPACFLPADSF